jgi:hypothetical protein
MQRSDLTLKKFQKITVLVWLVFVAFDTGRFPVPHRRFPLVV